MNKYKIIIIVETIIILLLIPVCYIHLNEYKCMSDFRWFRETSPDNKYTIIADCECNNSKRAKINFTIYNNHKTYCFDLFVKTNGKKPNEDNYELEWHDDYLKLTIINYATNNKKEIFRLYWEDLSFSSNSYDE